MASERTPRVMILGGGFAGLSAALELDADRFDVTLIDRSPWFEFLPNIHELLSGVKPPDLLRLPLEETLQRAGHGFRRDTVTAIDPAGRRVLTRRRRKGMPYDMLIVCLGGENATRGVEGVEEHALPFKSVDQCQRIGKRLARLATRKKPARVVIVGGGLEGIEALGEILRRYRDSAMRISIVEARDRLLPEAPASIDEHLRSLCEPYAVEFRLGSGVERIESDAVVLGSGDSIPSDLTIWTGGPAPPALLVQSGLAPPRAWAPVDKTLQSLEFPGVFIAGDAAECPEPLSKQAYHAIDMGACAARNAARLLEDRALLPFSPSGKPTLVSFGDLSCFLVAGGRALAAPSLAAAKEAVFQIVMAQLDPQPLWKQLPRAVRRADRAATSLLWPTLTSHEALLRQAHVRLLASD